MSDITRTVIFLPARELLARGSCTPMRCPDELSPTHPRSYSTPAGGTECWPFTVSHQHPPGCHVWGYPPHQPPMSPSLHLSGRSWLKRFLYIGVTCR